MLSIAAPLACSGAFSPDPSDSGVATGPSSSATADASSRDDASASLGDAGGDGATSIDAGADADAAVVPRCDKALPFGAPELVRELSTTAAETAAGLTQDERTIYFARDGVLFVSTRPDASAPFGTATRLAGLGTDPTQDDNPAVTVDGRTLFFSSKGRGTDGRSAIFRATTMDGGVAAPSLVPGLTQPLEDAFPIPDGGGIYYSATRVGTTDDIYFSPLAVPAEARVPASDTNEGDGQPVLSRDELRLYFGSRRAGTIGGSDIYVSTRASKASDFAAATSLGNVVNSTATDLPVWVSADDCVLYLTSDRAGGAGGRDLYRATRK